MSYNHLYNYDERLLDNDIANIDGVDEGDEMYEHFAITVDKGQSMIRLDKYLTARLENTSRNRIQCAADGQNILVYLLKPAPP